MSSSQHCVLLLTHSGDYYTIDRVAAALDNRGAAPFRFDTDCFPLQATLSARFERGVLQHQLTYGDCSIAAADIQAVWARKIWPARLSAELDPRFHQTCRREAQTALRGFLGALENARWMDRMPCAAAGEDKLHQLRLASQCGLTIPRTLVTNDPDDARDFFHRVQGPVIAKLLTTVSYSMKAPSAFVYTNDVSEQDLEAAESLRYSPMVFQERIPKARELRVVFVAGAVFVGALEASQYDAHTTDWRKLPPTACSWQPAELPADIIRGLTAFMAQLNLTFGAIDMIEQPDGRHVFLEVNPCGEWGMLERDLDYPISEAIADALLA